MVSSSYGASFYGASLPSCSRTPDTCMTSQRTYRHRPHSSRRPRPSTLSARLPPTATSLCTAYKIPSSSRHPRNVSGAGATWKPVSTCHPSMEVRIPKAKIPHRPYRYRRCRHPPDQAHWERTNRSAPQLRKCHRHHLSRRTLPAAHHQRLTTRQLRNSLRPSTHVCPSRIVYHQTCRCTAPHIFIAHIASAHAHPAPTIADDAVHVCFAWTTTVHGLADVSEPTTTTSTSLPFCGALFSHCMWL